MTNQEENPPQSTVVDIAYENLRNDIQKWQTLIQTSTDVYDLAFFKLFVKFEGFLVTVFKEYICGNGSLTYIPERRLSFEDLSHFEKLVKSNSKGSFIDYLNIIENFSKEVFVKEKNPFDCVFSDANLKPLYSKMRFIRNHIAHESNESRLTYHRKVLSNLAYIEPNEHLQKQVPQKRHTYFTEYINAIENAASILKNPTSYF
ncbi:hypothetical protein [Bacillus sp. S14(2024)]|uniref:hypothetical protein n=1 Tax=Bacillus sp. S14(2024) TaxID=3162884 RepID=UPI003D1D7B8B